MKKGFNLKSLRSFCLTKNKFKASYIGIYIYIYVKTNKEISK